MCGISAYVGSRSCKNLVLEGLSRLEYRGYDSAGILCFDSIQKSFQWHKSVGDLTQLRNSLKNSTFDGHAGMGQTRWATHGGVNYANAHPHFDCSHTVALVHNGIIENHQALKASLKNSHHFSSQTDSEVVAHLIEEERSLGSSLSEALCSVGMRLQGSYAFIVMDEREPTVLYVLRNKIPLVIGVGNNEVFIASDFLAFSDKEVHLFFPPDKSCIRITNDSLNGTDFLGKILPITLQKPISSHAISYDKNGYEHYLLKEIHEQEASIVRTINFYAHHEERFFQGIGFSKEELKNYTSIVAIAAGTSYHVAASARYFFETIAELPMSVELASEFCYSPFFSNDRTLYFFISQSGETLDTLEALRLVKQQGGKTVAVTNVETSSLAREADGVLLTHAGPEFSVASTKSFTAQLALLYWTSYVFSQKTQSSETQLYAVAHALQNSLHSLDERIKNNIVPKYRLYTRFIFLGRHIQYFFACEAALKLKELSYVFAQAFPAGELKHGPLALIDETIPVVLFSIRDHIIYRKLVANAHEIKARKGRLLIFAFEDDHELIDLADDVIVFPPCDFLLEPLLMSGVMQLFVYHFTVSHNLPVDKPRNLAKSVTVE